MATTSFTALRRLAGIIFTLVLLSLCLTGAGKGQTLPPVIASAPVGITHPSGWGDIQQTAIDSNGNWIIMDYGQAGVYEIPASGAAVVTLVPKGGMNDGVLNGAGSPGIVIDPGNNLYIEGTLNDCLLMYPYGSATSLWPLLASTLGLGPGFTVPSQYTNVTTNIASQYCLYDYNASTNSFTNKPTSPAFAEGSAYTPFSAGSFQPYGLAIGQGTYANSLLIGTQNGGNGIFSLPVSGAWTKPVADCTSSSLCTNTTPSTAIIKTLTQPAISIAVDPYGNIYFIESSGGLPGVYEIPVGTTGVTSDCPVPSTAPYTGSSCFTRVDPSLPNVTGVITDATGNLYISDGTDGVFLVPAATGAGEFPDTSASVLLTPVPAQGEVAIDPARKILDVPTTQKQNNDLADVAAVGIGHAEFGSSPVGTTAATAVPVDFSFNASITPASFTIVEAGMATPEFAITTYSSTTTPPSGYCDSITTTGATTLTTYTAQQNCFVSVTYTPSAAGNVSARLLMLDANNDILASMLLHGTGTGAIGQVSPILESSIGSTLITPTQMVTDALDNVYVADPGLKEVVEYSAGSSTAVPIGTGSVTLASPTGVAVDGAGDVFIADSGNVYEVPFGPSGLNAAGIVTLKSGLGSNLSLAADGLGDLYVADPSNGQVLKLAGIGDYSDGAALTQSVTTLTAGFTAPSVVAVDSNNNLYIIDGTKLFEIVGGVSAPINSLTPTTKPTALVSTLTGVTGLATEPSGAVYISSTSGTWRIPLVRGSLSYSTKKAVAPDVTSSSSVALDRLGNVYVTPTGGSSVRLVSATGTLSLSLTPPATSTTATATIMNIGNASLLVSGYTDLITYDFGANVSNFTGADGTCVVDSTKPQTGIAPGNTCNVVVTFDPGAGQSDALTGWVQATSNAANAPITIDTNGTGPILANSQVQVTVGSGPQVIDVPLTVTVIPASGTGTPTGSVQVTYESWTVVVPTACLPAQPPCAPKINPVTVTASSALTPSPTTNSSTAMFTLAPVLAGPQTITVGYTGDRTYNWSTGDSGSVTIAQSAITGFIGDPNPPPYLPFVLSSSAGGGQAVYFDTSPFWTYAMPLTVNTAAGIPTGTITFNDNSSTCPPGTTVNGVGAATCQLANYSGVACPESVGAGVQFVKNNGSAITGGTVTFTVTCLQEPSFTKYTPVVWTHYITSVYSGDQNFIGATDPVSSLFQSLRSPEVSIATSAPSATTASAPPVPSSAGSLTVQAGSTASLPLYITPLMGYGWEGKGAAQTNFNFPVSLQCDNLPPHTTCTFTYPTSVSPYQPSAPNSVQICPEPNLDTNVGTAVAYETLAETGACNANGVGVVTLTINTNVPESTTTSQNASRASITLASIFGLGMVGLFFRRRAFQKAGRLLMFVMMIVGGALSVSLAACSTTNLTLQSQLATPPGTYAVSITAAQVGTQCVPQATGASIPCTTPSGAPGQTVYASNVQVSLPYYINLTVQAAQ